MSFVQREIDRIRSALLAGGDQHYNSLYAAQQALEWVLEPTGIKSPFDMITGVRQTLDEKFIPENIPAP